MQNVLEILYYLRQGLLTTCILFLGGSLLAALFSLIAGFASLSRDVIVKSVARAYIEVFRGTSALVQLFWFYFAVPLLLDIHLSGVGVGILVLGLNIGAYGAEVIRSALLAVPRGQWSAGRALHLSRSQILRHIIWPQAVPIALPPAGNLLIELLKSTALVSMIAVTDLTRAAMFLRDDTLQSTRILLILLVLYLLLSLVISRAVRAVERTIRWRHVERIAG